MKTQAAPTATTKVVANMATLSAGMFTKNSSTMIEWLASQMEGGVLMPDISHTETLAIISTVSPKNMDKGTSTLMLNVSYLSSCLPSVYARIAHKAKETVKDDEIITTETQARVINKALSYIKAHMLISSLSLHTMAALPDLEALYTNPLTVWTDAEMPVYARTQAEMQATIATLQAEIATLQAKA